VEKENKEAIGYLIVCVLIVSAIIFVLDYVMGESMVYTILITVIITMLVTAVLVEGYVVWKWNRNYRIRKAKKWPHLIEWHRE
jgi:membrane-bound ClpP family serine protease